MRFVILGAGAVGGVVGACLHQAGFDVTLIARGSHLEPGVVQACGSSVIGMIDVGRYPSGVDERREAIVGGRWEPMEVQEIDGQERAGSSSWQSLARGTRAIETDYLNGEIVLLGRLHGVATPVNEALCELAGRHARDGGAPGQLSAQDVAAAAR
jgi:2-dehydropantoate 2-reductase